VQARHVRDKITTHVGGMIVPAGSTTWSCARCRLCRPGTAGHHHEQLVRAKQCDRRTRGHCCTEEAAVPSRAPRWPRASPRCPSRGAGTCRPEAGRLPPWPGSWTSGSGISRIPTLATTRQNGLISLLARAAGGAGRADMRVRAWDAAGGRSPASTASARSVRRPCSTRPAHASWPPRPPPAHRPESHSGSSARRSAVLVTRGPWQRRIRLTAVPQSRWHPLPLRQPLRLYRHRRGPEDVLGTVNLITDELRLAAAGLARRG
jgi:hypothetical protein